MQKLQITVPGCNHPRWKQLVLPLGPIYYQWQTDCQEAAALYEYTNVCAQTLKAERVNYPTNSGRRGKKFQAQGGYHCLLRRLVLITFLYLSLTSFIKPSHKSCKVRLFSGYLHSSQMIDQGGLQYKPTWVMAFLLFSLHSLLSFYAVIVFSQNHNQAGCRSQVPDLFTNTPDQPPPPSPVICFMLLWILPPGVWGGLAQDRN